MSADLTTLLTQAEDDLARSVTAPDDALTGQLRSGVRHRRRVRHAREAVGALAVVAVVGLGSWAVAGTPEPQPAVSPPGPTATSEPSPTPTPTPDPSPTTDPTAPPVVTGPVVREAEIDDATVVARQQAPRTGEVWVTPERAPDMEATLSPEPYSTVWRVGQRGDGTLYVVVQDGDLVNGYLGIMGVQVSGLFEVDATGIRSIVCPSARTGDTCLGDQLLPAGAERDEETFLDTMTLPRSVDLAPGWRLTTTATTGSASYPWALLGDARQLYGVGGTVDVVADLGGAQVVRVTAPGEVAGLSDVRYAVRMPYGAMVELVPDDAPGGEFGRIRWDDGVARPLPDRAPHQSTAPSSGACFSGTFSVADRHVPGDWRPAGTTPGGHRVYLPAPGGNAVSRAVRAWQEASSYRYDEESGEMLQGAAAYHYATDEQFLADNALYAIQGPSGEWQLRLRADAVQAVYECA